MFDPRDVGNRPWMADYAQAPASLIFDDFVRVYFSTRRVPSADRQYVSYTGFVDFDRDDLTKVVRVAEVSILNCSQTRKLVKPTRQRLGRGHSWPSARG